MDDARAARKQTAILEAAEEVFLRNGYLGASMDEVAATAAISKQTLYKHFASKEALFHALIAWALAADPAARDVDTPGLAQDVPLDEALRGLARHLLRGVMQPRVLQLRRLVIGEANRFPELGRAFYDAGPAAMTASLAASFTSLGTGSDRPLQLRDPELAAQHLIWLVLSIPLNRAMLLGNDHGVSEADLDRYADAAVDVFLAAYRAPTPRRRRRSRPG